jgi:hypothetical protein
MDLIFTWIFIEKENHGPKEEIGSILKVQNPSMS